MGFVSKVGKNKNNHRERKDLHRGPQRKNSVELSVFLCALCGKKLDVHFKIQKINTENTKIYTENHKGKSLRISASSSVISAVNKLRIKKKLCGTLRIPLRTLW
jgi:hypothetical protein